MKYLFVVLCLTLAGCAGFPDRSYSLTYINASGESMSAGIHLGATTSFKK